MGYFSDDYSGLVPYVFHIATMLFAVLKCALSQMIIIRYIGFLPFFNTESERRQESCEKCVVCLDPLRKNDNARKLENCGHVFHGHCIDRWIACDHLKTCPLCRTPLSRSLTCVRSEPSWAVERLLYLFGDDLVM